MEIIEVHKIITTTNFTLEKQRKMLRVCAQIDEWPYLYRYKQIFFYIEGFAAQL